MSRAEVEGFVNCVSTDKDKFEERAQTIEGVMSVGLLLRRLLSFLPSFLQRFDLKKLIKRENSVNLTRAQGDAEWKE